MFQLVPQAWSLGIEVVVYCLSPWLFRRSPWLIAAVALASFAVRAIGYNHGLRSDPWDYRFFPFELGLFCLGALAYRIAPTWFRQDRRAGIAGVIVLLLLIFAFPHLPDGPAFLPGFRIDQLAFLAVMSVAIAPVFGLSKRSRWDRAIGDLSYPLYLIHLLVIQVLASHVGYGNLLPLIVSLALAWGMARLLAPVERIRRRSAAVAPVLRPATQLEG